MFVNNNNNNNNKVIYTAQIRQGCKCAFSRQVWRGKSSVYLWIRVCPVTCPVSVAQPANCSTQRDRWPGNSDRRSMNARVTSSTSVHGMTSRFLFSRFSNETRKRTTFARTPLLVVHAPFSGKKVPLYGLCLAVFPAIAWYIKAIFFYTNLVSS